MAKTRNFGPVEQLDREMMKQWMAETGVHEVEVWKVDNLEFMQRVGLVNANLFGVKKRFQKAPRK